MLFDDSEPIQLIMVSYFRPNDFQKSVKSILSNTICSFHLSIIDNSHGGLDTELALVEADPRITIYKNSTNIGKGAAFNRWFKQIMGNPQNDHFVSIDADILVPQGWLFRMEAARTAIMRHESFGVLAPIIQDNEHDTFDKQLAAGVLTMHNNTEFEFVDYHDNLYRNRYTAGPLFLVSTRLFNRYGYCEKQLYGSDDGRLCHVAHHDELFIGITSDVSVIHLNADNSEGYQEWKNRNVTKDVDHKGYWDQSDNPNSNDQ